ncbi:hypothetical protein COOONC_17219, partial [Cooperia oncophora]
FLVCILLCYTSGPETTLSLLLNLEAYEIIPGTVADAGVILSIHDSSDTLSTESTSGIHLEAGKAVTIPINEVRRVRITDSHFLILQLSRYQEYCGRRAVGPFSAAQYSRAACQWVATMEEIEKACRCRPVTSPFNQDYLLTEKMSRAYVPLSSDSFLTRITGANNLSTCMEEEHPRVNSATFKSERKSNVSNTCVALFLFVLPNPKSAAYFQTLFDHANSSFTCPEDCDEVSFSSVVFGGRLVTSDLTSLLPGDWEDVKEAKVNQFQRAMDVIPNHRIPVVKEVQLLANSVQEFARLAIQVFSLMPNVTTIPCLAPKGTRDLDRAFIHFKTQEPIWERITT